MPHGLNCACALCSARRNYLDCAARIIQRRIRFRAPSLARARAAIAQCQEQDDQERRAADLRGDCHFCTVCTLPYWIILDDRIRRSNPTIFDPIVGYHNMGIILCRQSCGP